MRRVAVFLGSSHGTREVYADAARQLGKELAARDLGLVYGGGNVGLMGVIADTVLEAGGHVIGVIPEALRELEVAHTGLPDLRVVGTMHERKALMADLADGFVTLPGGLGTLDECFEILTWAQLGVHTKPCGLLEVEGYFDRVRGFLEHAVAEGFLRAENLELLTVADSPAAILDALASYAPPRPLKWIGREER